MTAIRFFTDEDIHGAVAQALRRAGLDAISTPDAQRIGSTDEDQLLWASAEGHVIVTFNVSDFTRMHAEWIHAGRSHSGIIVSSQRTIGDVVARLIRLSQSLDADAMRDRLEFLTDW
jgi:hypothetical protein